MSAGKRKDDPPPSNDDGLLTSEDLFADLVDQPAAPAAASPEEPRRGPIKVQVSEPGAVKKPEGKVPAEALADDFAALLDVFAPAEPAAAKPAAAKPAPPRPAPAPEETLPPGRMRASPAAPSAPPSKKAEPPSSTAREADPLAAMLRSLGHDRQDEEEDDAPLVPTSRTGTKFAAARPSAAPSGDDAGLDLGALVGDAFDAPAPPRPKPPAPASPAPPARPTPAAAPPTAATTQALRALDLPDDEEEDTPLVPTSRTGTKFNAASAAPPPAAGRGLDLLGLADTAFADATPPHGHQTPTPTPTPTPAGLKTHPGAGSPPPRPPERGERASYGPYQLLEKIATGGMAEVFMAKRTGVEGFEKVVAVKRILPHLSDNKEFVDMFIDEAKMVAGLAHPNIVQIFDLGKIEKTYYIAMEYVHGRDLRSILRRARERGMRIPLDLTTFIVGKVCLALEYAHRKKDEKGRPMKIVHRDISPQNILISFEGDVKLADFGIAKAASKATSTERGALRGKLLYMSPEQAWGKAMDRRSDLFSLGIVFYEMVTDQKPFVGGTDMSVLEMVRTARIAPPTAVNPKVPPRLEKVMVKALDRDPDARYQDAAEMYRDIERVLHERQPPTALGLSRFLELLFDPRERGDHVEPGPGDRTGGTAPGGFEIDFDHTLPGGAASTENRPAPAGREPLPGKDPMSIETLLKRFGIK